VFWKGDSRHISRRGARLARRDEGANLAFVTEEQHRQAGYPAREMCCESPVQDTKLSAVEEPT